MRIGRDRMLAAVAIAAFLMALPTPMSADNGTARFFFAGDGRVRLHHAHFNTEREFTFRRPDGSYDLEVLAALRHFFRSRSDGEEGPLSLRLIEMIDFVEDRFQPRRLVLYSAYRSPALNAQLKGTARASLHTQGLAADVGLEGMSVPRVWEELRHLGMGGVGLYPTDGVLHLDAGNPRFWGASTSRVGEDLSAGNARVFARTEFDRYDALDDAVITLHSVTAFPLGLQRVVNPGWQLLADDPRITADDDCLWIRVPSAEYRFRLRRNAESKRVDDFDSPARIALQTCAPRAGRTPPRIETNRFEMTTAKPIDR